LDVERIKKIDQKIRRYEGIYALLNLSPQGKDMDVVSCEDADNAALQKFQVNRVCKAKLITFVNIFSYYRLLDSGFPTDRLDTILVDGLVHVKLHNFYHKEKINRVSFDFSSLANDCLEYAQKNNLKVALIGAKADEIKIAVMNLQNKYRNLCIVYSRNGYFFSGSEMQELCNTLRQKGPDLIILGMGTPEQEKCALYLSEHGLLCPIITCGGFLTQVAKRSDYYRYIVKKLNLRWLQRAIEFKHVRKRLFVYYPKNIIRYFIDHTVLLIKRY
jgi:N-acetylglucosaminyldiphosphoundecaprenol N-acetyl-beta-D-mannosaminyltransferase